MRVTSLQEKHRSDRYPRLTYQVAEVRKGVYVAGFGPYVKIGISTNVYGRMAAIQTPEELKVYAILNGWVRQERQLHRRFAEYRLRGEWFKHEGALAKWIIQITGSRRLDNGVNNGRSKLTEAEVVAIRAAKGDLQRELAAQYGISRAQVSHIRSGKNWAHIT